MRDDRQPLALSWLGIGIQLLTALTLLALGVYLWLQR